MIRSRNSSPVRGLATPLEKRSRPSRAVGASTGSEHATSSIALEPPSSSHRRPRSRSRSARPLRRRKMPLGRRIRYFAFTFIILTLVLVYVTTGEANTRNSDFYRRTVAMIDARSRFVEYHDPLEPMPDFPPQPIHRAGGLHFAEPGGGGLHGTPDKRAAGRLAREAELQAAAAEFQAAAAAPPAPAPPPPPVADPVDGPILKSSTADTDESLKDRLRQAELEAKRSADDRYRALEDIEAEVEKDREARAAQGQAVLAKKKAEENEEKLAGKPSEKSVAGRKMMPVIESVQTSKPAPHPTLSPEEEAMQTKLRQVLAEILSKSPVTIFSKSYCPFSKKAKRILLEAHTIKPAPFVVELDHHPQGVALQQLLMKTTGRRTVPNILINGKSLGGGDETELLWKSGELPARLKQMAGKRVSSVDTNFAFGQEPVMNVQPQAH